MKRQVNSQKLHVVLGRLTYSNLQVVIILRGFRSG